MKNNQNQSPNIILGLPINNTFAVPRLGNVQLRLHFLRRGTSGGGTGVKNQNPQAAPIPFAS